MKRLMVLGLSLFLVMTACAKVELSDDSKTWLKNYETVVDEYLVHVKQQTSPGQKDSAMSNELKQKIEKLSQEAGAVRKKLKPGEALVFYKELTRITAKLSVDFKANAMTN